MHETIVLFATDQAAYTAALERLISKQYHALKQAAQDKQATDDELSHTCTQLAETQTQLTETQERSAAQLAERDRWISALDDRSANQAATLAAYRADEDARREADRRQAVTALAERLILEHADRNHSLRTATTIRDAIVDLVMLPA